MGTKKRELMGESELTKIAEPLIKKRRVTVTAPPPKVIYDADKQRQDELRKHWAKYTHADNAGF